MRLLLTAGDIEPAIGLGGFQLRQGLPPVIPDKQLITEQWIATSYSSTRDPSLRISPDFQWVMQLATDTSINIWKFVQGEDPDTRMFERLTLEFNPIGATAPAISNEYMAVGSSTTPRLYIYSLPALSLVAGIDQTGLGPVACMAFSPSGDKLAVCHTTAPYLRVYNVADWSYVDAPITAGTSRQAVSFTGDGLHVVTTGLGSPYICSYDAALAARQYASTNAAYGAEAFNGLWPCIIPDPRNPKRVYRSVGTAYSTRKAIVAFDAGTGVFTDIMPVTGLNVGNMAIDPLEYKLYTQSPLKDNRYLHEINLETLEDTASRYHGVGRLAWNERAYFCYFAPTVYRISGTVRDISNMPAAREVRAYRRRDGLFMAKTRSDPSTGNYSLVLPDAGPYDVQFMIEDGELLNDLFFARAEPDIYVP